MTTHRVALASMSQAEMDTDVPAALNHDIRLSHRSVILVRSESAADRATVSNPQGGNFVAQFQLPIPSLGIVHRSNLGWTAVDVDVNGRDFRVVDTFPDGTGAWCYAVVVTLAPFNAEAGGPNRRGIGMPFRTCQWGVISSSGDWGLRSSAQPHRVLDARWCGQDLATFQRG